jgi:HEAT repeat protein
MSQAPPVEQPTSQPLPVQEPAIQPPNLTELTAVGDVPGLIRALGYTKDPSLPSKAAEALVAMGGVVVFEPLIDALQDAGESPSLRSVAAFALGRLRDARASAPLADLLGGSEPSCRVAAAQALGEIGDRSAVEPLVQALEISDRDLRRVAAKALGKLGDARAVGPLFDLLQSSQVGQVRVEAAQALGEIGDPRATDPLVHALQIDDNYVRDAAAAALGKLGDVRAVGPLIDALQHDQATHVRSKAAQALGQIGDPRAVDPLIAALRDADADMLGKIPGALAELGDRRAVAPIAALLRDQRSLVVGNAAEALLTLDPQQGAQFLTERGMSFNPLDKLPGTVPNLAAFGLVARVAEGGTRGYRLTDDGLLYADGMFGTRSCSEHPSPMADLNAVSRGRLMVLNADELITLAAILLGESITQGVVKCAAQSLAYRWIGAVLMPVAGSCAHGIRHGHRPGLWRMPPDLDEQGRGAYRGQLEAKMASMPVGPHELLTAVLASDVLGPSLGVTG